MVEELFKKYYPEYVTEKGECLSPYWDLFSAGVICATFELNNKIAELKAYNEKLLDGDIEKHNKIVSLEAQIEKMKNNCLDLMRVQSFNLTDDYMAGMYNGMAVVYNSCFLDDFEKEGKGYCHKNNFSKWELVE